MNRFRRLFTKNKNILTKEEYFKTVYQEMEKAGIDFSKGKSGELKLTDTEVDQIIKENEEKAKKYGK